MTAHVVGLSLVAAAAVGGLAWAGSGGKKAENPLNVSKTDTVAAASATGSAGKTGQLVVTGSSAYALSEDRSAVYEWTRGGWLKIGGPTTVLYSGIDCYSSLGQNPEADRSQIFKDGEQDKADSSTDNCNLAARIVNRDTVMAVSAADGQLYRYEGTVNRAAPGNWSPMGDPGAQVVTSRGNVYRLSADRSTVSVWTGRGTDWTPIGGPWQTLYAGGAGLFATSQSDGSIHQYDQQTGQWKRVGDPGAEFAVGTQELYGLAPDRSAVWALTVKLPAGAQTWPKAKVGEWRPVGGPAQRILAGRAGLFRIDPGTGDISRHSGLSWTVVGGPGADFAVGRRLFGVSPDRSAVHRYISDDNAWRNTGAGFMTVPEKLKRVEELLQGGLGEFNRAREAVLEKGEPDIYGFNWGANGCNAIKDRLKYAGIDFRPACVRHDFGYRNYREILNEDGFRGGVPGLFDGSPKSAVDKRFREDLNGLCAPDTPQGVAPKVDRPGCFAAAHLVYKAVDWWG
ncbi:phospholipase A2 [Streptomyces sp. NPDC048604]|uniref:phospholipase A2 n=1 Tax=Streptomyces sp. NPDC048604 TaxID=3365578 RepID=UPI00371CECA8